MVSLCQAGTLTGRHWVRAESDRSVRCIFRFRKKHTAGSQLVDHGLA